MNDEFDYLAPLEGQRDTRFPNNHNELPIEPISLRNENVEFPAIRPPSNPMPGDARDFTPNQTHGYDEVILKGDIKERGEMEFTEKTGWIYWRRIAEDSSSSSSSSSDSSDSSSSSSSSSSPSSSTESSDTSSDTSESGSSKDSCVVPVDWNENGFTALYCVESEEVLFLHRVSAPLYSRKTKFRIDPRFISVCLSGSVRVHGINGNGGPVWANQDHCSDWFTVVRNRFVNKADWVDVLLVGTRKDCVHNPWPDLSKEDFIRNEERIALFSATAGSNPPVDFKAEFL